MKQFTFIIFSIFSIYPCMAQMPTYDEVATHFVNTYYIKENKDNDYKFQFAKMKNGWYLYKNYYNDNINTEKDFELFWSKIDNRYLNLNFIKTTEIQKAGLNIETEKEKYRSTYGAYNFEHCLFAGYRNWDFDIINELANKQELSEFELESLARAYSNYAMGFLFPEVHGKVSDETNDFRKELEKCEQPSAQRANLFAENESNAIAFYQKLKEKNPAFQTMVGDIQTKLSGEYIYAFTYLTYAGFPELAKEFLPDSLFDSYLLNYAKCILKPLKQNAILFTYGDLDTYPLIYMQEKFGFRKDVIILNISQLQLSVYLKYFDNKYPKLFPASFSTYYCCKKSDYFYLSDNYNVTESKYINAIATKLATLGSQCDSINLSYALFSTNKFLHYDLQPSTLLLPTFMYLSDVSELLLIINNLHSRPIYYTLSVSSSIQNVFYPYTVQKAFVNEVTDSTNSKKYAENTNNYVYANVKLNMLDTVSMRIFFTDNDFSIDTTNINYKNNNKIINDIYIQYAADFLQYAAVLKTNNQQNSIAELYKKNEDIFYFNDKHFTPYISLAYLRFLCDLGMTDKCSKVLEIACTNIENNNIFNDALDKRYLDYYINQANALLKQYKIPNKKVLSVKLESLKK